MAVGVGLAALERPAHAQDADQDGVTNAADAFPCDAAASGSVFVPGEGAHAVALFEDQWPALGDADFNDVVVAFNYEYRLDGLGRATSIRATFDVLALGGMLHNGLGLHLPIPRGSVGAVTLSAGGAPVALTASSADAELTVTLSSNLRALFGGRLDQINSTATTLRAAPARLVLDVTLAQPTVVSAASAPHDLFIFRAQDPAHQIHFPAYAGTATMRAELFGTASDGSSAARHFVDDTGLPFAVQLPSATPYPAEGTPISQLFPHIVEFAASAGASAADFYARDVSLAAAYRDSAGAGATAPEAIASRAVDRSCLAAPITAPLETWTYVPFPEARCANGSSTGIAVNLTQRSDRVAIFMAGGGACWNYDSCYAQGWAVHMDHDVNGPVALGEVGQAGYIFDREHPRNPFRDASFVFVPYCTGDAHGGRRVVDLVGPSETRTTHFVGGLNMDAYLARLGATFPAADRVWLVGASAGGYGTMASWWNAQAAFPQARVDVLDDSGTPVHPIQGAWDRFVVDWGWQAPPGCPSCVGDLSAWLPYLATTLPAPHRYGLLAFQRDTTMQWFFNHDQTSWDAGLNAMRAGFGPAQHALIVDATMHGMLQQPGWPMTASGMDVFTWVEQFATDDPAWDDAGP